MFLRPAGLVTEFIKSPIKFIERYFPTIAHVRVEGYNFHTTFLTEITMSYKILNGNELLIQGALEAGFHLYTGYPGSPLADFFNILYEEKENLQKKGIRVVIANSEANAAAMASGAKMSGHHVLVAMKSMGLHVASDALSVGNFANPASGISDKKSGVVIAVGDDPWSISTSTPADSRYLFKHLHIPFLEPSTPQELKDWIKVALELSSESSVYVGVILTTFMAEGGGRVFVNEEKKVSSELIELNPSQFKLSEHVMVPPNSLGADKEMIQSRFPRYQKLFEEVNLNQFFGNINSEVGIISAGGIFETLKQVLEESTLLDKVQLLKVGSSYPLDKKNILPFLKKIKKLIIHLNTSALKLDLLLPKRLPTFCPGCPHRETLSVMKEVRSMLSEKNINMISHGDVGCYSLSFLEPFKEMHDLSAMGQGGALGAGTDLFTKNPSVVLMGDSTFFHSGMVSISNSVQLGHNITYILLDNDNTAMTGHQVTPRTGVSVEGEARPRQNMLDVARSLQVAEAIEVNPSDRYFYKNLFFDLIQKPGVKVIVSNKECGLTFHGRLKREERKIFSKNQTQKEKHFYQINTLACEDCRACVDMTGCPGLSQTFDAYGTKVTIDPQICVSDSYCTKIKACPSFELVKVFDYHPSLYQNVGTKSSEDLTLPSPEIKKDLKKISEGYDFRSVIIGVGGSGVTTISRVLAEAALSMGGRDDLNFKFVDQKGLAQRNGSVSSHVSIFHKNKSHSATVPLATADVVISPDLLEGARAFEFLSTEGPLIIDSDYQVPLSVLLDRGIESDVVREKNIRDQLIATLGKRLIMGPFKKMSYEKFGRPVYASAMILGVSFQSGNLPFGESDLKAAFKNAVPKQEFETNWEAFQLGRKWFLNENHHQVSEGEKGFSKAAFEKSLRLATLPWQRSDKLVEIFGSYFDLFRNQFKNVSENYLAHYLHDLLVYDHGKELPHFYHDAQKLQKIYSPENHELALRILAKTFWVKDEVFVSHLMVSNLKEDLDRERYQKLGTSYEVVHINRPAFDVFGRKIEFDFSPKKWMLHFMKHARFLRILMPDWHKKERSIALKIRSEMLETQLSQKRLKELDSIKGYREVRYQFASKYLGENL